MWQNEANEVYWWSINACIVQFVQTRDIIMGTITKKISSRPYFTAIQAKTRILRFLCFLLFPFEPLLLSFHLLCIFLCHSLFVMLSDVFFVEEHDINHTEAHTQREGERLTILINYRKSLTFDLNRVNTRSIKRV